jgi:outer membrane protein assembly factor BamB
LVALAALLGACRDPRPAPDVRPGDLRARDRDPPVDLPAADRAPRDRAREIAHDLLEPDLNLALCKDASTSAPDATSAAPLPVKPALAWKTVISSGGQLGSLERPFLGPGGNLHITDNLKDGVVAVSPAGKLLWSSGIPTPMVTWIKPAMPLGDIVVFGGATSLSATIPPEAWLFGFRCAAPPYCSGTFMRQIPGPFQKYGRVVSLPARAAQADAFHIAYDDGNLYTYDAAGTKLRSTPLPGWNFSAIAVDETGTVYLGLASPVSRLVAVSASGKVIWSRKLHLALGWILSLALTSSGDLLVAVMTDNKPPGASDLVKLDRHCGTERWRTSFTGQLFDPILIDVDGTSYVHVYGEGKFNSRLVAVSPAGKEKWSTEIEHTSNGPNLRLQSVGPIGADGVIYALIDNIGPGGIIDGPPRVRAYSRQGKELWNLDLLGASLNSFLGNPALLANGLLFFGARYTESGVEKSYALAVQTPSPGLAKSPWPRAGHDNQNSANLATPP